jgi:carboxyl-terminal processing protease
MNIRSTLSRTLTVFLTLAWCSLPSTTPLLGSPIQESDQNGGISPKTAKDTFAKVFKLMSQSGALESTTDEEWAEMKAEYKPRADAAKTNMELRIVLSEMIESLGKSHFALIPKEASTEYLLQEEEEVDSAPEPTKDTIEVEVSEPQKEVIEEASADIEDSSGPGDGRTGLEARFNGEQVVVTRVVPGSPADKGGIKPGWEVLKVRSLNMSTIADRFGKLDTSSMSGYQGNATINAVLTADPGTAVPMEFKDFQGAMVERRIEATPFAGDTVTFGNLGKMEVETETKLLDSSALEKLGITTERPMTIGLIRFNVWMVPIMQPIAQAIEEFRTQNVDAVVIDLRGNPGGIGGLSMGVGGHFLSEPTNLGTMKNSYGELKFNTNPQTVSASGESVTPLEVPLFILIDEMSASTSEIFAGGMMEAGRATIVGRRTPGMALPAVAIELPNGDVFYYAIASFTLPSGGVIEGIGVSPQIPVALTSEAYESTADPDLAASVNALKN